MAAHDPFIGAWQLLSQVALDADGQQTDARGPHPVGLLIYQPNGWMSVQLMRRERRSGLSLNAIHTAMSEYLGYFGTYVVNPASETVTHFVIGASFPGYINTQQVRFYRFEDDGDRLILAAEATLPGQTQRILTWKRA
jgi:hypothetical protein